MQLLHNGSKCRYTTEHCVKEVLTAVPTIMEFVRHQMRGHRQAELTVPQFRSLIFLSHSEDTSLSAGADHVGLSLPAASRMVDILVKRGLMDRQTTSADRRRVSLSLTQRGKAIFRSALDATEVALAQHLGKLPPRQLAQGGQAMKILARVFDPENCPLNSVK